MSANPYDRPDACACDAWDASECSCGDYVDPAWVRAWDLGYQQGLADARGRAHIGEPA